MALQAYDDFKLADQIEKVYLNDSPAAIQEAGYNEWVAFHTGSGYKNRQASYDGTDRPIISGMLHCTLDFNQGDK